MSTPSARFTAFGKRLASYFLQGLLLVAPAFFTILAIYKIFDLFDSNTNDLFERLFHFRFPGLGILAFVIFITLVGAVGGSILLQPILDAIERLLENTPLVKDIYSSVKDFVSAFISNKKKFNKPVIVEIGKGSGIFRMGFVTDDNLSEFSITDKVAVYFPQSYTFAGHLFLVNKEQLHFLPTSMSANVMKYILSGGVMEFEEEKKE